MNRGNTTKTKNHKEINDNIKSLIYTVTTTEDYSRRSSITCIISII